MSPNYFNCDFEIADLIRVDEFLKFIGYYHYDPYPFIVNNIKEQLSFINFFSKKFIDKHGYLKSKELIKVIQFSSFNIKDRIEISSLDVETKIESFNRLLNNIWLKPKNKNIIKHRFNFPKLSFNLNDIEF